MEWDSNTSESDSDEEFLDYLRSNQIRRAQIVHPRPNLFEDLEDDDFHIKFRLSKSTVLMILNKINNKLEFLTDRNHSVSPINQLLLTLRFYATGSFMIVVGDFMGVHKSTASRIVHRVTDAISSLRAEYIKFPTSEDEKSTIQMGFYRKAAFPKVVGAIDCTHIKIQSPGGENSEDFRNRKSFFSFNVQTVSDHQLKIIDIVARWPGSAHDATIFNNSVICARFENNAFGTAVLVGDSGYPCRRYLIPPLRNPVTPEERLFNESQIRTRNAVERQYGVWKRRFPVLALGIRLKLTSVQPIIVACAVLHNIAIDEKETIPHVEPQYQELVENGILEGNIQPGRIVGGNEGVRQSFIHYFRTLLN